MVKKVFVPKFEAADGSQFDTERAAQLHEWWSDPQDVNAIKVKFAGGTRDLMGNLWTWACGRCKTAAPTPLDTVLVRTSISCSHCGAGNLFDFSGIPHR